LVLAEGHSVKLTACAVLCPAKASISLQALVSGTWTTVAAPAPVKCGKVVFTVKPMCKTSYRAVLTSSSGTVISNTLCICVVPKVTLCVREGTYASIVISGTVSPAEPGANVTVTIDQVVRCYHTTRVATLTVPLTPGTGNSSMFATNWAGGTSHTTYVITVKVAKTACLEGVCATRTITL
jgi:hypothetical protein